MLLRLRDK